MENSEEISIVCGLILYYKIGENFYAVYRCKPGYELMKAVCAYVQILLLIATSVCWAENPTLGKRNMSLDYFLLMDNGKRSYSDIATVNLLCAKGLPGAENIDPDKYLSTLKEWARLAESETEKLFPRFYKNPQEFSYSEEYFRILVLVTVLSVNLGVRYNPDLIIIEPTLDDLRSTAFFRDSRYIFIHGLIEERLGTCSSIPVLTVSVGRLMGYPLRLVNAKAHLFARWEDDKERFNIESGGHGLKCHPDEHYMRWPFRITKSELETGFFLKSLSPTEEMATFLGMRAVCLLENKRAGEALKAYEHAYSLYPNHPYLKGYIESLRGK